MPDDGSDLPTTPPDRTTTAMAERVAVLETKTDALREDTSVIRGSLHNVNNEMQKFVAAELRCAESLAKILDTIKELPVIAAGIHSFNEMRPELRALMAEHEQKEGLAAFGKRFAMIVSAAFALTGVFAAIAGGLLWLTQHLKP